MLESELFLNLIQLLSAEVGLMKLPVELELIKLSQSGLIEQFWANFRRVEVAAVGNVMHFYYV